MENGSPVWIRNAHNYWSPGFVLQSHDTYAVVQYAWTHAKFEEPGKSTKYWYELAPRNPDLKGDDMPKNLKKTALENTG